MIYSTIIMRGVMKRIDPGCLAKGASLGEIMNCNHLRAECNKSAVRITIGVQQAFKPIADSDNLPSQLAGCLGSSCNDGIDSGKISGTHIDRDAAENASMSDMFNHNISLLAVSISSLRLSSPDSLLARASKGLVNHGLKALNHFIGRRFVIVQFINHTQDSYLPRPKR